MDVMQYINVSEDGLSYTVDKNYFSLPSVAPSDSNSMLIEQGDVNNNDENNNIETSSSSSPLRVQSKSMKKGKQNTYRISGAAKGLWPELEACHQWYKDVRARGGCVMFYNYI